MEIIDRLAYTVGLDLTGLKTDAAKHDYIINQMATKVKGATLSKEQAEIQLTQKLKQLTLSRKDFALWELGQEVGAFRKAKADETQIAEYQAAKLKELAQEGSAGAMLKRLGGVGGLGSIAAMAGLTTGIAGVVMGFRSAIKAASDFEDAMAEVSTIVDTNTVNMGLLNEEVKELSKSVPQSATELGKGLYQVISAGVGAGDAMSVLGVSAKAATAGITDSFTAVDAITTALNAYKLSASQASYVSDLMFKTVEKGKLTFPQLAGALGNVASIASSANVRLEELFAAIATLTQGGIDAASSTTYLAGLITQIISPTDEARKVVKQLGIEWNTAAITSKGLVPMIKELADATAKATKTDAEQLEMIMQIVPERRAARAMLALVGKQYEQLTVNLDAMNKSQGAADVAFQKMQETASAQWHIIKNKLNVAMIEFGASILPGAVAVMKLFASEGEKNVESLVRLKNVTENYNASITSLKSQYAEWQAKIEAVGGVTGLSAEEQSKYNDFLNSFKTLAPDAISAYDALGNVIGVNADMFDRLIEKQNAFFKLEHQAQWDKLLKNYEEQLRKMAELREKYGEIQKGEKFLWFIPTVYIGNAQQDMLDMTQTSIDEMSISIQQSQNQFKEWSSVFVSPELTAHLGQFASSLRAIGDIPEEMQDDYKQTLKEMTAVEIPRLFDNKTLEQSLALIESIAKASHEIIGPPPPPVPPSPVVDPAKAAADAKKRADEEKKRIAEMLKQETALYDKILDKHNAATSTAYEFAVSKLVEQYRIEYDLMDRALKYRADLTGKEKAARLKMLNDVYGAEMKKLENTLGKGELQEKISKGLIAAGFKLDLTPAKLGEGVDDTTEKLSLMDTVINDVGQSVFEFSHDFSAAFKGVIGSVSEYAVTALGESEDISKNWAKAIGVGIPLLGDLAGSMFSAWASARPLREQLKDLRSEFEAFIDTIRSGQVTREDIEAQIAEATHLRNSYLALVAQGYLGFQQYADAYQQQIDLLNDMLANFGQAQTDTWTRFIQSIQTEFDMLDIDEPLDKIHRLINAIGQAAGEGQEWAAALFEQILLNLPQWGDLSTEAGRTAFNDWILGLFSGAMPGWWTGTGAEWTDFLSTFESIGDEIIDAIESGAEATIEAQAKSTVDYRTAASITEGQWYETMGIWTTMRDYIRDIRDVALSYVMPGNLNNMPMIPAPVNIDLDIHWSSAVNTPAQAAEVSEALATEFIRKARAKGVKIF